MHQCLVPDYDALHYQLFSVNKHIQAYYLLCVSDALPLRTAEACILSCIVLFFCSSENERNLTNPESSSFLSTTSHQHKNILFFPSHLKAVRSKYLLQYFSLLSQFSDTSFSKSTSLNVGLYRLSMSPKARKFRRISLSGNFASLLLSTSCTSVIKPCIVLSLKGPVKSTARLVPGKTLSLPLIVRDL